MSAETDIHLTYEDAERLYEALEDAKEKIDHQMYTLERHMEWAREREARAKSEA